MPENPGVYIMKNSDGKIIYVGKAINLKKRVRQYFQKSVSHSQKVKAMVKNIAFFEYVITDNELEALILECSLIKKNRPKYNILLKDDKTYPYIKINLSEKFPTVEIVHKHSKGGGKYFGPYSNATALKNTMNLIYKLWPIRRCKKKLKKNKRPCLNYFIKQCSAPCCNLISEDKYNEMISQIIKFLEGNTQNVIKKLKNEMRNCAQNLEFEKAIDLRDKIIAIENVNERQKIEVENSINRDIIGFSRSKNNALIKIFFMRDGKIINQAHFFLTNIEFRMRNEILAEFIKQFYSEQNFIPKEIIVSEVADKNILEQFLSQLAKKNIKIICPQRGDKYKLLCLASKNANMLLERNKNDFKNSFDELKKILHLEALEKLEAYDISNTQGTNSVGAMICVTSNGFDKKNYRRYKIKNVIGANDYKSMQEVIERRMKYGDKPDLLLIDGGRGHVHCVQKTLDELKIKIPVCGMVKDSRHKTKSLFYNEIEIELPQQILNFIAKIQDEIHRFAISYHKQLREKAMTMSILDDIKKIGPKRKKNLLSHFGSIQKIIDATVTELMQVENISQSMAEDIYHALQRYRNL